MKIAFALVSSQKRQTLAFIARVLFLDCREGTLARIEIDVLRIWL